MTDPPNLALQIPSNHQPTGQSMNQGMSGNPSDLGHPTDHQPGSPTSSASNSSRWRWNADRDLALIELVHAANIWNVKYGQTTQAWNGICDALAAHPSASSQKSSRPSPRTAQVRYYELLDKFRAAKSAALLNHQLPVIQGRLDELLSEIDEQNSVPGKKGTPAARAYRSSQGYDETDLTGDLSHTPTANSSLSLSNGRVLPAKREDEYGDSDYPKRRKLESASPFNLSQFQPHLQPPSSFYSHHPPPPMADPSQFSQLIAQNNRLIEMHEANLRLVEQREKARAEQEERQTRILQEVQNDIRQIYGKIMSMVDSNSQRQSGQMTNEMMGQNTQ